MTFFTPAESVYAPAATAALGPRDVNQFSRREKININMNKKLLIVDLLSVCMPWNGTFYTISYGAVLKNMQISKKNLKSS